VYFPFDYVKGYIRDIASGGCPWTFFLSPF